MNSAVQPTIREDGPTNPSLSTEYEYAKEIYEVGQIYTRLKNSVMLLFITAIDQYVSVIFPFPKACISLFNKH